MKSNEKQCNANRSKAKQRKAGRTVTCASSSPAHPKAMQSNAKQCKAMQSKAKQCNAKRSKAKQRKAGRTVTCASSSPAHLKAMPVA